MRTTTVEVDVIVPVHNAAATLRETIASALHQVWLLGGEAAENTADEDGITIYVCCYNDASTDESWAILQELQETYESSSTQKTRKVDDASRNKEATSGGEDDINTSTAQKSFPITTHLCISTSPEGTLARGAGYARNRAVEMRHSLSLLSSSDTRTDTNHRHQFLCWLDSDDVMHPTRVYHQVSTLLNTADYSRVLLGCRFDRIPADATWHYAQWANNLCDERLMLERFREVTLLQPTWMMCRSRFDALGGYLEAPPEQSSPSSVSCDSGFSVVNWVRKQTATEQQSSGASRTNTSMNPQQWRLVHAEYETPQTLRVAEDLRFFHEHIQKGGILRLCRSTAPLLTYRHRAGQSQCSQTPRKLLLHLRVAAFEKMILNAAGTSKSAANEEEKCNNTDSLSSGWEQFVVWGAGRDAKDFVKALSPAARRRVYCMVDVDDRKIERGFYVYTLPRTSDNNNGNGKGKEKMATQQKIPILHFSLLVRDPKVRAELYHVWKHGNNGMIRSDSSTNGETSAPAFGRIDKAKIPTNPFDTRAPPLSKRRKASSGTESRKDPGRANLDLTLLPKLPVVVCVAMYRTNGALESNVKMIGRSEGKDLWHFS